MKPIFVVMMLIWSASFAQAQGTAEQPDRNSALYNLEGTLGLKGYDPVSYFEEGGAQASMGDAGISQEYGGVTYHFNSDENRLMFLADPTKYEPTYGGFCAWAMSLNSPIDIIPDIYTIKGDRIHFFFSRGAKARFDFDAEAEGRADGFWMEMSGESPRL